MSNEIKYSFKQWCLDNNRQDLLDRWDYDKNTCNPDEISFKSEKHIWIKCPEHRHNSELKQICNLPNGRNKTLYCDQCRSFAQHIIDKYDESYLQQIWNTENSESPWNIAYKSHKKIKFNCLTDCNHVYTRTPGIFMKLDTCPICESYGRSLAGRYPQSVELWSEINEDYPENYTPSSSLSKYWKCDKGIHLDYKRSITDSIKKDFKCQICLDEEAGKIGQIVNIVNHKFGELTVTSLAEVRNGRAYWNCTCSCGNKIVTSGRLLRSGKIVKCNIKGNHNLLTKETSLGSVHSECLSLWSTKNEQSPYDYMSSWENSVWWKCNNGIHEDYQRKIITSVLKEFKCPTCGQENKKILRGKDHPNWKGTTPENSLARMNGEYKEWRKAVYKRDGYICQVCLNPSNDDLKAHHLYSFAKFPTLRYNINNGITCCCFCHDNLYSGSFHQQYGTINFTPNDFSNYANKRRAELGIKEPFDLKKYMKDLTPTTLPYPKELPPDFNVAS